MKVFYLTDDFQQLKKKDIEFLYLLLNNGLKKIKKDDENEIEIEKKMIKINKYKYASLNAL